MAMQKIEGTDRVDEATGKRVATYLFDDGSEAELDEQQVAQMFGTPKTEPTPDVFSVDMSQPAYTGMPTQLTSQPIPQFNPLSTAVNSVTAGVLGTTPETLQASGAPTTPITPPSPTTEAPEVTPAPLTPPPAPAAPLAPVAPMMATTTESQLQQTLIPEDVKKAQTDAYKAAIDAAKTVKEAEEAAAKVDAEYAKKQAEEIRQFNENRQIEQVYEQAQRDALRSKIDAAAAKYEGMEIDAGRYWSNKSVGSKILAAIAVGLGAYAQSMGANRENPALTMIRAAIDNDIKAQEANMAKAGKFVETQRGMYADLVRELGDKDLARWKTHELGLKAAEATMQQQAAMAKNPAIKARYEQQVSAAQLEQANLRAKQEAKIAQTTAQTVPVKPEKPIDVPGTVLSPLRDAAARVDVWDELEKQYTSLDQKRLEEIAGPIDQTQQEIYKFLGWEVPEDAAQLRAETDIARFKFVKAMTGAGVNVQELAQYEKILPNLKNNPKTALAIIRGLKQSELKSFKKLAGREIGANPQYAPNILRAYSPYLMEDQADLKKKYNMQPAEKK